MENEAKENHKQLDNWIQMTGMSQSYFHALFRKHIGCTPKRYWNQLRVEKAKEDLRATDLSITDLACKYNFSAIHQFTKWFKRLTGVTPSEYRKEQQQL